MASAVPWSLKRVRPDPSLNVNILPSQVTNSQADAVNCFPSHLAVPFPTCLTYLLPPYLLLLLYLPTPTFTYRVIRLLPSLSTQLASVPSRQLLSARLGCYCTKKALASTPHSPPSNRPILTYSSFCCITVAGECVKPASPVYPLVCTNRPSSSLCQASTYSILPPASPPASPPRA